MNAKSIWRLLAISLLGTSTEYAAIITNVWVPIFKGIDHTTAEADANEPRRQKVFALRVDRQEPTLEFLSTPSNGDGSLETFGQTTTTFVNAYGVAVAINANFFSPVSTIPNDPRDLSGLAISHGEIVSTFTSGRPAALITRSNQVSFLTTAPANYSNYWTAVAGSDRVLINGVAQLSNCVTSFCNQNPRTAVGFSSNGRYIYLMVIDGRQTGWSDGATLYETGQWLLRLGAWNGLNLDGGGSTAMAKLENGTAMLLNRPSGGVQRVNGNHLGVFAQPMAPVVLVQPEHRSVLLGQSATFTISAGGTTPLRYQWRLNGTNLAGATATSLTRANVQLANVGDYSVVVTNVTGLATSAVAKLTLLNPPSPPRINSVSRLPNGQTRLVVSADAGRSYAIETSPNLVNWSTLTNVVMLSGAFECTDGQATSQAQRYYRVRWPGTP